MSKINTKSRGLEERVRRIVASGSWRGSKVLRSLDLAYERMAPLRSPAFLMVPHI
jgi:hypothetical protein